MPIIFTDEENIEVDGVAAGKITDVLSNYPTRKAEVLKAWKDRRKLEKDEIQATKQKLQDEKDARKKEKDDAETDKIATIESIRRLHVAELDAMKLEIEAAKEEKRLAVQAEKEANQDRVDKAERKYNQLVEQLEGTEVVQRLLKEKRQAEKAKRLAEIEAEKQRLLEAAE